MHEIVFYGSETWFMAPHTVRTLGDFHHRLAHRLKELQPCSGLDGGCMDTQLAEVMSEVVLQEVETYVSRLQNTVTQYIATWSILDMYLAAERQPGQWCPSGGWIKRAWNWWGCGQRLRRQIRTKWSCRCTGRRQRQTNRLEDTVSTIIPWEYYYFDMRFLSLHIRGSVARNDIFGINWRSYGPKRDILEYWGTLIICILSYYILSMDK